MNWIKIIIASIFEIAWVLGLTHANNILEIIGTIFAIIISFYLLINVSKYLPVGTSYAVFVGLGTTGVTLCDFLIFNQPFQLSKVIFIFLLLVGVIGLKLVTDKKGGNQA